MLQRITGGLEAAGIREGSTLCPAFHRSGITLSPPFLCCHQGPVALRSSEKGMDAPHPPRGILVVLQRPRAVREPPAPSARQPGLLRRKVKAGAEVAASRALQKDTPMPPDGVGSNPPRERMIPASKPDRGVSEGSRDEPGRIVPDECRVNILCLDHPVALGDPGTSAPHLPLGQQTAASLGRIQRRRWLGCVMVCASPVPKSTLINQQFQSGWGVLRSAARQVLGCGSCGKPCGIAQPLQDRKSVV